MRTRHTTRIALAAAVTWALTAGCSTATTGVGEAAPAPTSAPVDAVIAPIGGLGTVALATPTSGGGVRPLFVWEPADGAVDYVLTVRDAQGQPYWSWVGPQTQVLLGLVERPSAAPGPRITAGMSWDVIARDGHGVPVAVSPVREIAP